MVEVRQRGTRDYVARIPLTHEERAELEAIATHDRTSQAEVIRRAVREYAERLRKDRE